MEPDDKYEVVVYVLCLPTGRYLRRVTYVEDIDSVYEQLDRSKMHIERRGGEEGFKPIEEVEKS